MIKISKVLLYCNKSKPYLYKTQLHHRYLCFDNKKDYALNGKVLIECDFEVEKIFEVNRANNFFYTKSLDNDKLEEKSCLNLTQLKEYLFKNILLDENAKGLERFYKGYAIHIKNLHIFDKPKELNEFLYEDDLVGIWPVERTPKNYTIIATDFKDIGGVYCCKGTYGRFLALSPYELRDILNGKKTVVVRKTVSKEML